MTRAPPPKLPPGGAVDVFVRVGLPTAPTVALNDSRVGIGGCAAAVATDNASDVPEGEKSAASPAISTINITLLNDD